MALKGKTTIQIFDGGSGELVKEIHEENMITNAVDTILNPPDYLEMGMDRETDRSYNPLHIFKCNLADTAFRGVIVCRDAILEDADNMMLPWTNEEIGHAGISNTSTDKTIGTYNSNESGVIENGKGYRHVWDFGTDKANGEIGCVCMTTKDGGTTGYHDTYWELSAGGLDLNSSSTSSFQQSYHAFLGRYINDSKLNSSQYKWFYMDRLANGNIRVLGKHTSNGAIYEVIIFNPFAISLSSEKPFCEILSVKKVIELFPAASRIPNSQYDNSYFHGSYFFDCDTTNVNYVPEEEKEKIRADWDKNPQWLSYFPYVHKGQIHIVAQNPWKIYHYVYDVNSYSKISETVIPVDVTLQNYEVGFNYVRISNSSPYYRWFYGREINTEYNNILSGFFWDDKYFLVTENPLINGEISAGTENYAQLRTFSKSGKATGETLQYWGNGSLSNTNNSWWGFYIDEKTNTPLLICDSYNYYYLIALMIRKTKDGYGWYRMRSTVPTYGSNALYSYADIMKVEGVNLPLYVCAYNPYNYGDKHYFGFAFSAMKLCLTTINNLLSPVRKLEGQTMKITYDIVEE